jgi:hypothetical protein
MLGIKEVMMLLKKLIEEILDANMVVTPAKPAVVHGLIFQEREQDVFTMFLSWFKTGFFQKMFVFREQRLELGLYAG